jgi:scyllo-inositol 2-dehydrogenase (NADP+)
MKKLRVGIIGQGRSGYSIHVHTLSLAQDKFQIVAVCDPIVERTREAKENLKAEAYTDYRKLLERKDLDLVVNSSPSHLHVPITTEALKAGQNVLCEKPFARRAAEVDALIELAARQKRFLAVFQQSRYAPYFQQVRKVIQSGVLGRVAMVKIAFNGFARRWDWQTLQGCNGGNLLNTGPHPMDQALQLFGTDAMPQVFCVMDRLNSYGDAEDFVKVILRGPDRPVIDLEISSCDAYPKFTYHVSGQYGGLTGDTKNIQWKYYVPKEAPAQHLIREPLEGRRYCGEELPMHEETWEVPQEQSNMFDYMGLSFYANLYEALTAGAALTVPLSHIRQQIAVIEECHRQNPLSRIGA